MATATGAREEAGTSRSQTSPAASSPVRVNDRERLIDSCFESVARLSPLECSN